MVFATILRRCVLAVVFLLGVSSIASAQTVGDCDLGTAERDLDINDVQARVFNGGNLFYGNTTVAGDGYLVPKNTGRSPIFNMQLWVGGLVDGELRTAGVNSNRFEFWPGPLDDEGNPPDDCSRYDRIYVVSRGDVARYHETGEATDDLRDWPVDLGAPVLDGDGVEGNYNLAGGDEPAISGEQMAWWVMNDAGNVHEWTETLPIGIEVRVEAFAKPSLEPAVDQATLYRYRIRYGGEQPLDSAYIALFTDVTLGDVSDNYIASDTVHHMAVGYNGEETDAVYGIPPAVGVQVLQGPVGLPNGRDDDEDGEVDEAGERLTMTSNTFCQEEPGPYDGTGNYNCMRGLSRRGDPIREGGGWINGTGPVTRYMFPGDPVEGEFWSMENTDGEGSPASPSIAYVTPGTGPFRLEPGEETEFVFAIPFAQGADRLDSVVKLREAARSLQNAYDLGLFEPQRVRPAPTEPPLPQDFALRAFPNPFASSAAVELTVADGAGSLRLAVYDVLGREVAVLADGVLAPGEYLFTLDGAELPAGIYFVRLETGRQTESLTLVHVE
jgi:hypothetical protein